MVFRIDKNWLVDSYDQRVVALDGGGFAVAWTDRGKGAFVRVFDESGSAISPPSLIGPEGTLNYVQDLDPLPNGGFVVGMRASVQGSISATEGNYVQFFDSLGLQKGDAVQVSGHYPLFSSGQPFYTSYVSEMVNIVDQNGDVSVVLSGTDKIASTNNANFAGLAILQVEETGASNLKSLFTIDNFRQSGEFFVTDDGPNYHSAARFDNGMGLVAFTRSDSLTDDHRGQVFATLFDGDGNGLGGVFEITESKGRHAANIKLIQLSNDRILVTWETSSIVENLLKVHGRIVNSEGEFITPEFKLEGIVSSISSLSALSDGGFLVTESHFTTDNTNTYRFGPTGVLVNDDYVLRVEQGQSMTASHTKAAAASAELANGKYVLISSEENSPSIGILGAIVPSETAIAVHLGTQSNDHFNGTGQTEQFDLKAGDDTIAGAGGNDVIDGGSGVDTAKYAGEASHFSVTITKGSATTVMDRKGIEGTDSLTNVENLDFSGNKDVNLDILDGVVNVSSTDLLAFIEMYIAYFNRAPDAEGLFYWGTRLSEGMGKEQIAKSFYVQPETQALYTNPDDTEAFVTAVYNNFLGRAPDAEGFAYWVSELNSGSVSEPIFLLAIINGAKAATGSQTDVDYFTNKAKIGAYYSVVKGMSNTDNAKAAMALYDGSAASITAAKNQIDTYYNAALDANNGELLINLVGVMDDPFAV